MSIENGNLVRGEIDGMQERKDLKNMSVSEIKCHIYDASKLIQQAQNEIQLCELELQKRAQAEIQHKQIQEAKES